MDSIVGMLETEMTQFYTALSKTASKPANSSKVEWLEDRLFPRKSSLAASATSAAGTITVATGEGAYFNVNDFVRNEITGEGMAVTGVSTDTVGVTRGVGGVAAASSASGAELVITGNASLQGATLPAPKVLKRTTVFNYSTPRESLALAA